MITSSIAPGRPGTVDHRVEHRRRRGRPGASREAAVAAASGGAGRRRRYRPGRRKAISLTEAGRAVLREAFPLWQGAQAAFEDRHGGALVEQLRGTLRALESGRKTQTGD
jgi:hypothetical protein